MPTSTPGLPLRRRTALGGLLALGGTVTGCTTHGVDRRPPKNPPPPEPSVEPDVALAAVVLADEQRVLDQVVATLARHPQLAARLAGTRDVHEQHVRLLTNAAPDTPAPTTSPGASSPSASASASASTSPSATTTPTVAVPRDPHRALAALARAEDALVLTDKRSAFAAESGAFARVLASMAAAASQQATLLRARPGGAS